MVLKNSVAMTFAAALVASLALHVGSYLLCEAALRALTTKQLEAPHSSSSTAPSVPEATPSGESAP